MADYSLLKPEVGKLDYPNQYNTLVTNMEAIATEVEAAREGETNIVTNLTDNYAKYNLEGNIDGSAVHSTSDSGTATTLVDAAADFSNLNIGDYVLNITETIVSSPVLKYGTISNIDIGTDTLTITSASAPNNVTDWDAVEYIAGGYRASNMGSPTADTDYVTKAYIDGLTGSAPTHITSVSPGSLQPNDVLVINSGGSAITGRPSSYRTAAYGTTVINSNITAAINDNIYFNVSGGSFTITLPTGVVGGMVGFADIDKTVSGSNLLNIIPASGEKIMGQAVDVSMQVNEFPGISFWLLYVNSTFGWSIVNLKR